MIASKTNGFIFLKTRKTGGTSVELVLSTWCASPDVLSPLFAPDEQTRKAIGGCAPVVELNGTPIKAHMSAKLVRQTFPALWESAYKISIERHPYEKVVSRAFWELRTQAVRSPKSILAALEGAVESDKLIDREIYCIDGKVVADEIIFQPDISAALERLAIRFGKATPNVIPRAKSQFRTDRRPANEILSDDQKQRIRERMSWEFDYFGFTT